MGLKAEVEDISTVEEGFRSLYTEQNGKHVLTGVEGMVPSTQLKAVQTEAGGYRIKLKDATTKLEAFGDLKPDEVRSQLARIPELELAADGKLDDKKIEAIVETRIAAKVGPIARERDLFKTQAETLQTANNDLLAKDRNRVLTDAVRTAARTAKMQDTAIDDAVILAERQLEVLDDGNVVTKDKVGVTPGLDPLAWLQEMQSKRPHWWAPSQGGGAGGNRGGGNDFTGPNPFSNEHWNMTAQGKLVMTDPKKAEKMATAAGTSIGGMRPKAAK